VIRPARPPLFDGPPAELADARALPPAWVRELLGDAPVERGGNPVHIARTRDFLLATLRVADAVEMDGRALDQAAADAYQALAGAIRENPSSSWHPVRIWNFVPRILDEGGEQMDRYMRFNAGRYRAFMKWFGGAQGFDRMLPAASAVGHGGASLIIHLLAAREPGMALSNPRQVSPHRYSKRFGPLPPCFARATRLAMPDGRRVMLAGGTASIRGEESMHVGDLRLQLSETFENLAALVRSAFGSVERPLNCYRTLRVYYVREADLPEIRDAVSRAMPGLERIECMPAELCRRDLLVEIEGSAELP
jgi:chorismate lyase / 3-hydroxybenzoate synthase